MIRHRHDWGAILFCDERFSQPRQVQSLSKWVQPYLHTYNSFGEAQASLARFMKTAAADIEINRNPLDRIPDGSSADEGPRGLELSYDPAVAFVSKDVAGSDSSFIPKHALKTSASG